MINKIGLIGGGYIGGVLTQEIAQRRHCGKTSPRTKYIINLMRTRIAELEEKIVGWDRLLPLFTGKK